MGTHGRPAPIGVAGRSAGETQPVAADSWFPSEEAARAFDEALSEVSPASRRSGTARQDGCDRIHRVAYENVLIDRDGKVADSHVGMVDEAEFESEIQTLLEESVKHPAK